MFQLLPASILLEFDYFLANDSYSTFQQPSASQELGLGINGLPLCITSTTNGTKSIEYLPPVITRMCAKFLLSRSFLWEENTFLQR